MAKLSLWKPNKGKDFNFIDKVSREQYYVGSVSLYIHKYMGIIDQGGDDPSQPSKSARESWNNLSIQDMTLGEIRNRDYSDDVFELRGHYDQADNDFEMITAGLALADGTKFITFHLNDMIEKIGRKLISGDVIEMPNLRDDALLGEDQDAVNQWFVVTDASWPTEGFSPLWYPHLWRVKARPMTDSPEFDDITKDGNGNRDPLIDLLSTYNKQSDINDANVEKAEKDVPKRNFETRQVYVVIDSITEEEFNRDFGDGFNRYREIKHGNPWIFAGDGIPPNQSVKAEAGSKFPSSPSEGDFFLRTDYEPSRLFQYTGKKWEFTEVDYRKTWSKANRILENHINNENTFKEEGETIKEKQPISKAAKPKSNF